MKAEQIRHLDVIHHIQVLRAHRSQKVLPNDHYIWNSLNQNHYDYLHTLITTRSYSIDINQFDIIGEVGGQIAQEVNGEFMEQIEADIAAREDEEENRVLPQSSSGIADNFDDLSVQNLAAVADHSNVETFQRRNCRDDISQ